MRSYWSHQKYLHVRICSCGDVKLEAHSFDSDGKCACGYAKPSETVNLEVSYGEWKNGTYSVRAQQLGWTALKGQEASVTAPDSWRALDGESTSKFYKWEYSTDGVTWHTATASPMMSFTTTGNTRLRALYIDPITRPQVELSAKLHGSEGSDGNLYAAIRYHIDYELPIGCTFLNAEIRLGDNSGISYYLLTEQKESLGSTLLNAFMDPLAYAFGKLEKEEPQYIIEKREDSVLNIMTASTLSDYMYKQKAINVDFPPLYLSAVHETKGRTGSFNVVVPMRLAQKNSGNHWIYAIALLRYKDKVET